ncbi:MAG TPA: thermonuclease family protein [Candidatus Paceibacterota bacterium]|nr:thermonuclease family protein [Candidatus Paceibacterota bacterium]
MKNKKSYDIVLIVLVIVIILLVAGVLFLAKELKSIDEFEKEHANLDDASFSDNYVIKVIDGDTFVMKNGQTVRLICIDAPERGETNFTDSKEFLESLILHKEVRLEKDVSETDDYGRLLRYVYRNATINGETNEYFINKIMVNQNYAYVWAYGNDTKRCSEIAG